MKCEESSLMLSLQSARRAVNCAAVLSISVRRWVSQVVRIAVSSTSLDARER